MNRHFYNEIHLLNIPNDCSILIRQCFAICLRLFFFVLQWLNGQKLVESLVSLIDPEIDEEVSSLSFSFVLIRK